jgi:hypothetical protein
MLQDSSTAAMYTPSTLEVLDLNSQLLTIKGDIGYNVDELHLEQPLHARAPNTCLLGARKE